MEKSQQNPIHCGGIDLRGYLLNPYILIPLQFTKDYYLDDSY